MNVTLVNPPIEDFFTTGIRRQPLGLLYISSSLKKAGITAELINCHTPKKQVMAVPPEFGYLSKYINHVESELRFPFRNYAHYGMSWQEIERRIKGSCSDLYLVSSLFTTYYQESARVIEIIRKNAPGSVIAAGGYHPSLHPEYFIEKTAVDYVITGEGEISTVSLAGIIMSGGEAESIPGVISSGNYSCSGNCMSEVPDINMLPHPARWMLRWRDVKGYGKKFFPVITSRGCPNRCSFCTGKTIWGDRYRTRRVGDVIEEIEWLIKEAGGVVINFEDDNLFPSKKRAMELLKAIMEMKKFCGEDTTFTAMNGVSLEGIDEEIVMLMKQAGFKDLDISLVTHSSDVQQKQGRPFDSVKFERIARCAIKAGMRVRGYFILGMQGQNRKEVQETIEFMKGLEISVFPSVFYNVFSPENEWKMQRSSAFYNETSDLSREDLIRFFNICRGVI